MTAGMAQGPDADRRARVTLSFLADPGDAVLGAALRSRSPAEVLALTTGASDGALLPGGPAGRARPGDAQVAAPAQPGPYRGQAGRLAAERAAAGAAR